MITIFIAGDSTASIKSNEARPETGWGEKIHLYLNDQVLISNHAFNGKSTKSFILEERFDNILRELKKDDYVIIQFGHNDSKEDDEYRYAHPYKEYQYNLEYFIDEIIKKEATPIIFSSISRRLFLNNNLVSKKSVGVYPSSSRSVATRNNVLFINMFDETKRLYEYLGEEISRKMFLQLKKDEHTNYPEGIKDNTHLNDYGAIVVASLIANKIYKSKDKISSYVLKETLLRNIDIKRQLKKM